MENVCELLQVVEQGKLEQVKVAICKSLTKQTREEQRQQEKDRNALAVVCGARKTLDVVAGVVNGGRRRVCTGLMVVGSDVLTTVSAFLAWEKVELHRDLNAGGWVNRCTFSPCGNFILTCSIDYENGVGRPEMKLWTFTGDLVRHERCTNLVHDCCFTPDGKAVVTTERDNTLRLWNVKTGTLSRTLVGHAASFLCVDVSPNGAYVLGGSWDRKVELWNLTTDANVARETMAACTLPTQTPECYCCSISPNGGFFLFGDGAFLKLYDSATYQLQHALAGHSDTVMSCSFAPGGESILSGSLDCTLRLWCSTTGGLLRVLWGHTDAVMSGSFSPTGLAIVSGSSDATLRLWTAATGRIQQIVDVDSGG